MVLATGQSVEGSSTLIPDQDNNSGTASFPVAETSVAVFCFVAIIFTASVLILILKKARKRVIILSPPNVENPHYNHLTVLSSEKRFSLKRLSWKFVSQRSSIPLGELKRQESTINYLPKEGSLTSITSTNIQPVLSYNLSLEGSKQSLLNSNDTRICYSSLLVDADSDETSFGGVIDTNGNYDAEAYEIPEGQSSGNINSYSKLTVHEYSVLCEEGFHVPSEVYNDVKKYLNACAFAKDERQRNQAMYDHFVTHNYNKLHFFEHSGLYWQPASTKAGLYSQLAAKKYREIPRADVKIEKPLGSGHFASVFQGVWRYQERTINTAIKILNQNSTPADKVKFLQEAAIMGQFHHSNIVRLLGVVTIEEPAMIVLELLTKGDLLSYLRKITVKPELEHQQPLQKLFLKFAREIASGMEYLSRKHFIHRDLAARNVLLTDQLTCKIGDFGMARDLISDDYYKSKGGKIPIKWTAPEALLYKKFSTDSDVWSYGILLYEIWSLGTTPFTGFTNSDMISLAFTGLCHPPAPGLPRAIYKLMVDCWLVELRNLTSKHYPLFDHRNPDHYSRPKFTAVCSYLCQSDSHLLIWANDDLALSPKVQHLGASQSEAGILYRDLQRAYKYSCSSTVSSESSTSFSTLKKGTSLSTIPAPRLLKADSCSNIPLNTNAT